MAAGQVTRIAVVEAKSFGELFDRFRSDGLAGGGVKEYERGRFRRERLWAKTDICGNGEASSGHFVNRRDFSL